MEAVPDRSTDQSRVIPTVSGPRFIAKCGHEDVTAHIRGTTCENCVAQEKLEHNKQVRKRNKEASKQAMINSFMIGR